MIDTIAAIFFWIVFAYCFCYMLNQSGAGEKISWLGRFLCNMDMHSEEWETNAGEGMPWEPTPSIMRVTLKCGRCGVDRQTWTERA